MFFGCIIMILFTDLYYFGPYVVGIYTLFSYGQAVIHARAHIYRSRTSWAGFVKGSSRVRGRLTFNWD